MQASVGAMVLVSARVAEVVGFYRSIGFALEEEDHGDGIVHWACEAGDVHIAVFGTDVAGDAPRYRDPGSTFCGFVVDDVPAVFERLRSAGHPVVQEPTEMPWGLRAVVQDPDGRPVEIFQPAG